MLNNNFPLVCDFLKYGPQLLLYAQHTPSIAFVSFDPIQTV